MKLANITKEEFESTIGKTFMTVGTSKGCAYSAEPMHNRIDGSKYYGTLTFDTYEDYLKYMEEHNDN